MFRVLDTRRIPRQETTVNKFQFGRLGQGTSAASFNNLHHGSSNKRQEKCIWNLSPG